MNDKIVELEEYKTMINNKKNLDNKTINLDELPLEELEDLNNFLETEPSISKEEYRDILLAMDNIKKQYAYQKALDTFYDDNSER